MKTTGRGRSKNINDQSNTTFTGKRNQFVNESLKIGASSSKPITSGFGKQGTRKTSTGFKTGGGF